MFIFVPIALVGLFFARPSKSGHIEFIEYA